MTTVYVSCTPTAVDADGVCASQTPGAGVIAINGALATGGVATFGAAQKVRLTSGGNDSGITFTFTGTDADGNVQKETVAGSNASNSDTTKFYKTITSITKSGASAGTIVVGNLIASVSPTLRINTQVVPCNFNLLTQLVSGTATWGMDYTFDEGAPYPALWIADSVVTAKSANFESTWIKPIQALRLNLTASSSGNVALKVIQAGV
jgi:hypothetical protein